MPRGKILVIRGGAIGDFILTLPVLGALRNQFTNCDLEVLGYPRIAQLALLGGLVDHVRSIESQSLAVFFARHGKLSDELSQYFSSFSIIISYLYDPDEIFQTNVARVSKAQFIVGPHRPDESLQTHASEQLLKPLERLAIFDAPPLFNLALAPRPSPFDNLLAIHPGSGSEKKNWPEQNWKKLLDQLLTSTDLKFLLIGGEAEEKRLERLSESLPTDRFKIAKNLPLTELAHQLAQCRAFIGHDSGISHLAAALDLSGTILWGETNQTLWQPRSSKMKILHHVEGLEKIEVEIVTDKIREHFAPPDFDKR